MKTRLEKILSITLLIALVASITLPVFMALSDVTPELVEIELQPGESYPVEKTVTNPPIPPKLDFLLLEDETGSFSDDIALMKGTQPDYSDGLAAQIWDDLVDEGIEFRGAVAGFADFAQAPWGWPGGDWYGTYYPPDWVYTRYVDLTDDKATWLAGIGQLTASMGADGPEAQLPALMSAANGAPWDSNGDSDYNDPEDTPEDENPSWSDDTTKIVILVTDAPYHKEGETPAYPGPSYADTVAALNAEGIHVVILSTNTGWYTSLADDTGGAVKQISSDSSDIVEALMEALEEVLTDVWYEVSCPPEIDISLDPVMYHDVSGGSVLAFTETITASEDAASGEYECTVTFYANTWPHEGAEIGTETIKILVNTPPCCEGAYADPVLLWPPNHKWVDIHIMGVVDADGDEVTITVTGVWQDEPTEGLGDGDHSPDAIIHGDYVEVRAERSGIEDGRVYHIYFTATDEYGGYCEGEVTVGVPHDKKDTPVDGGPLYDSTLT